MIIFSSTVLVKSNCSLTTRLSATYSFAFKKWGIEYSPSSSAPKACANDIQLVVLHLTDSIVLTRPSLYVSSLLLALRAMLQMDLPHLNVLTKIDNLQNYPDLPFNLDFYTEVQDLNYLLPHLNKEQTSGIPGPRGGSAGDPHTEEDENVPTSKFSALNQAIVELVEGFALVGFETLAVEDKQSMMILLRAIDRAGGYAFGTEKGANDTVWQLAMRQDAVTMDARDVQERWLDRREEMDEEERKAWEQEARSPAPKPQPPMDITGGDGARRDNKETPRRKAPETNEDEEMEDLEDLEEMKKFMEKNDSGIKVMRNQ